MAQGPLSRCEGAVEGGREAKERCNQMAACRGVALEAGAWAIRNFCSIGGLTRSLPRRNQEKMVQQHALTPAACSITFLAS